MPRFEKWLRGVSSEAPADEVARIALTERLLATSHFLDKSIRGSNEAEAIHQLRVWSRRATAAIKLFEPTLRKSQGRWTKKKLRKMRRAAGAVRDCDVHLERLTKEQDRVPKQVTAALKKQRREARQKLKAVRRRLRKGDRLALHVEHLLETLQWPKRHSSREAPSFGVYCRQQLAPLAAGFFKLADADLHDNETLHALRIAGKQWRYALELAPEALPARQHGQLYQALNDAQDRLGEVCDQLAAIEHLRQWQDTLKKKGQRERLEELLARDEKRLEQLRAKVIRWWTPARRKRLRQLWKTAV